MNEKILMILGALILVGGGSYALYDYLRGGTVEVGESCGNTEHCKTGACIHAGSEFSGICAVECSDGGCDSGFHCQTVDYTTADGTTIEGYGAYCVPDA